MFERRIVLYIFVLFLSIQTAFAIKCYQCTGTDSNNPFQCNEWLSDYDIVPEDCDDVYGAKYCVKHIGRFEGGIGAKRYCSSLDLGNYCNYVQQPGDKLEYRTCVHTCTGDGCNSASGIFISNFSIVLSIGLVLYNFVK